MRGFFKALLEKSLFLVILSHHPYTQRAVNRPSPAPAGTRQ